MKKLLPLLLVVTVIIIALIYFGRSGNQYQTPQISGSNAPENSTVPSNNIYLTKTDPTKGNYMTDFNGMTLYTFDKDANGTSSCVGSCSQIWPIYTSGATAQGTFPTNITVISRSDGSKQFAYKGMALYYYSNDVKAGDLNGDGIGGIWHIVKL